MKVCYVILHYKNIHDTIKCIESLMRTASHESKIVVVDNGSGDGSGKKLVERYINNDQCEILLLQNNLGFSQGNNHGYKYARENYAPDFVVISNNDVVFHQCDFEQKVSVIYQRTQFDVLGPDVYIPRHRDHQNPLFKTAISVEALRKELAEYEWYKEHPLAFNRRLRIHALKNMLCSNSRLMRKLYAKLRGKDDLDYTKEYVGVGLQGSCLIFSRKFIEKEECAFSPEPFLYEEEVFLYYRCHKLNYKMVYSPEIAIRHEEAASFKTTGKTEVERLRFMLEHHVKARRMLLDYLEQ